MSDYNLIPLNEYVNKQLKDRDEVLSLHREVAAAKYTLEVYEKVINNIIQRSDGILSVETQTKLMVLGEEYLDKIAKISRITKAAVEVEAIKATRLDSLQVLTILRQVPHLVEDVLTKAMLEMLGEIASGEVDYFKRDQRVRVASKVAAAMAVMNEKLSSVSVPEAVGAVTMEQVEEMLTSVPTGVPTRS